MVGGWEAFFKDDEPLILAVAQSVGMHADMSAGRSADFRTDS